MFVVGCALLIFLFLQWKKSDAFYNKPMNDCTVDLSDGAFSSKFYKGYPMLEIGYEEHYHEEDGHRRSSTVECENGLVHWQN